MSKGSNRRPQQVPDETLADAWDRIFNAKQRCNYPDCKCPFDAPSDPNWCARGLPKDKEKAHVPNE